MSSSKLRSPRRKRMGLKDENYAVTSVDNLRENLSFCGCGFLGIYHVGVASCFHEYAPQLSMHKISGASVGALVAVSHLCGNLHLAYAATDILRVAIDARARALGPFHPSFDINNLVRDALERGLPDDVHEKVSNKLHISLTRVDDGQNVVLSQFNSKDDVIQALICSCFIPFWSGMVAPKFRGVSYVDGGFSNNLLTLDDKTVTVSPFAGEADICPQDDVFNLLTISLSNTSFSITPHNLYRLTHALLPPPPDMLRELWEQGFADGVRFLQRMNLISCNKCSEFRSSLLVTETRETFIDSTQALSTTRSGVDEDLDNLFETNRRGSQQLSFDSNFANNGFSCGTKIQEEYYYSDDEDCDDCLMRRQNALKGPLPSLFTDRIRKACDNVNKSLYNWFYLHRPIKYISYLMAPYYLPANISLALFMKFCKALPSGTGFIKRIYDLKDVLLDIARRYLEESTTSMLMSADEGVETSEDKKHQSSISVTITRRFSQPASQIQSHVDQMRSYQRMNSIPNESFQAFSDSRQFRSVTLSIKNTERGIESEFKIVSG